MSGPGLPIDDSVFLGDQPACLYDGLVMHQRMKPFLHRFSYRVWALLADIDRLDEISRSSRLFSHNRFNLFSLYDRDHGAGNQTTLRAHIDRLLAEAGKAPPARVVLLCYPRVLGYTFNPIAVYYCLDHESKLCAMIYEVRNTFGDRHTYVAPVAGNESSVAGVRQERDKLFYVSPFLGFGLTYRFRCNAPGEALRFRILEVDQEGPVLAASFSAKRLELTSRTLMSLSLIVPLLGVKVMASIHWEAAKLWLKGARLVKRPKAPPPASLAHPLHYFDPEKPPTSTSHPL